MAGHESSSTLGRRGGWIALAGIVATAAGVRASLLWGTSLVPGMNGGYYLIQARALLEHGALGIPDLPLTFFLQAGVAKLVQLLSGRSLEDSILLAVRLCDALLPPLVAVPVYLIGRKWCAQAGRSVACALAAAAVVALGAPALSMTGDFEKNSLGLVWLAALAAAQHAWMAQRSWGRAARVLLFLGLCGLTHIGVFGVALLLAGATGAADLVQMRGLRGFRMLRRWAVIAAAGAAVIALTAGLVLWKFDPARIRRLGGAIAHPVVFLQTGGRAGTAGGDAPGLPPMGGDADRSGGGRPGFRPNDASGASSREAPSGDSPRPPADGRMGPPGGGPPMPGGLPAAWFFAVAVASLVLPMRQRRTLGAADRAITIGCAVTTMALTGPWLHGDVTERLRLIAMIPAACAAAFAMTRLPGRWSAAVAACALASWTLATSVPLARRGGHPTISTEAAQELRALVEQVTDPSHTLIVARHGLEWWTAWILHTHVAQGKALCESDWTRYATVLFLEEKGRSRDRSPDGSLPGMFRDHARGDSPRDGSFNRPPPQGRAAGMGFLPPGGPGGTPPMMDAAIPDGAEILHDGDFFRLARVTTPVATFRHPTVR